MKASNKKYFILALAGAVVIGLGIFVLINNYFEKVEIIAAGKNISSGKQIEEQDIKTLSYYRYSLPTGYISDKSEIIGKTLLVERIPGDPITAAAFEKTESKNLLDNLNEGEVLTGINIESAEPVAEKLSAGSRISIVSTEKEKNFQVHPSEMNMDNFHGNVLDMSSFLISENILVIDGQVIIKNLEVISVEKVPNKYSPSFSQGSRENIYIFLRCSLKEAPVISRVLKSNNYKIFLEKS